LKIVEIFKLSMEAIRERKARSALTIIMVLVGCSLMIALNGISAGQSEFIKKQLNSLAPNILFVSNGQRSFSSGPGASQTPTIIINTIVVNRIKSLPFVNDVVPAYQGSATLETAGNTITSSVVGTDPQKFIYMVNPSVELVPGSSIQTNNPSGIIFGDTTANPPGKSTPFATLGQTVRATYNYVDSATGKQQTVSKSFVVTGILAPTGNNQLDRAVIINTEAGNSLFLKAGKFDQMVVAALSGDYVPAVQNEITSLYGNNIGITTPKAILQARERFTSGNASFIQSIAFIALLVGAIGIVTTLYNSVNERISEIGTIKAIGAARIFILLMFLFEALMIGLIGSTFGVASGVFGAYALSSNGGAPGPGFGGGGGGGGGGGSAASRPQITPIFVPGDVFNVWVLSVLLSILAGLYPAWKASGLSPVLALKR
jgi:putative ABC transport system permease protein